MARSKAFHGDLTKLRRDIEALAALHAVPNDLRALSGRDFVENDSAVRIHFFFPIAFENIRGDYLFY